MFAVWMSVSLWLSTRMVSYLRSWTLQHHPLCQPLSLTPSTFLFPCTWASTRRCLIRVMDFCRVSFSGGIKTCSSCSRDLGPVTMKLAIWSFRLFRDCTARRRQKYTNHHKRTVNNRPCGQCAFWLRIISVYVFTSLKLFLLIIQEKDDIMKGN